MAGKTYAILGGGGSFGIHAAFYLLDHAQPKKVIGIGRNPLRPEPFSLGIAQREGYVYHARHVTHELWTSPRHSASSTSRIALTIGSSNSCSRRALVSSICTPAPRRPRLHMFLGSTAAYR